MKVNKLMLTLALVGTALISVGCSSDDDDTAATVPPGATEVNLLGTWDYNLTLTNNVCSGLIAKGITTVQSLNGDITKIGNILIQGEGFDLDKFGNCVFTVLDEVETSWSGRPAVQTAAEYLSFTNLDNAGDSTIAAVTIDSYTDRKILETTTLTNTVVITSLLTR